jgi:hypothetical protein
VGGGSPGGSPRPLTEAFSTGPDPFEPLDTTSNASASPPGRSEHRRSSGLMRSRAATEANLDEVLGQGKQTPSGPIPKLVFLCPAGTLPLTSPPLYHMCGRVRDTPMHVSA